LGTGSGSRDLLLNFGNPLSKELLKIQTTNLVCGLTTRMPIKNCKIRSTGNRPGSHDLLLYFGTSSI